MSTTKTIAVASLLLMLLPAGQAFASIPTDVGHFQMKCMTQGGTFGALGHGSYDCGYLDGSTETCAFDLTVPACTTIGGPAPHRNDQADNGNTGPTKPVHTPKYYR